MKKLFLALALTMLFTTLAHADIKYVNPGDEFPLSWQANPVEDEVVLYTLKTKGSDGTVKVIATVTTTGHLLRVDDLYPGRNEIIVTATDAFGLTSEDSDPHSDTFTKDDGVPPLRVIWVVE